MSEMRSQLAVQAFNPSASGRAEKLVFRTDQYLGIRSRIGILGTVMIPSILRCKDDMILFLELWNHNMVLSRKGVMIKLN